MNAKMVYKFVYFFLPDLTYFLPDLTYFLPDLTSFCLNLPSFVFFNVLNAFGFSYTVLKIALL